MNSLSEAIEWAKDKGVALGHFNVADSNQFLPTVAAAEELDVPIVIGVSEGDRKFIGVHEIAALVKAQREQGKKVFLNADHTKSLDNAIVAIDAGYDAVLFDGTDLPFDENVSITKQVVAYAKEKGVLVEGELGYIGSASEVRDQVPEVIETNSEDSSRFVSETEVDLFAPAVGNIHGMLTDGTDPSLNIENIQSIAKVISVPIVLHGASGNSDEDIRAAIKAGVRMIHISTELRAAYRKGMEEGLAAHEGEVAPYKYLNEARDGVKQLVVQKLKLFNGF